MYLKTKLAVALIISLPVMATYAAKDAGGGKIDLTAIEGRVTTLETANADARLTALEAAVVALEATSYEGLYEVTEMSIQHFGCAAIPEDWANYLLSDPPFLSDPFAPGDFAFQVYFQSKSGPTARSAVYEASSVGGVLYLDEHDTQRHTLTLVGQASSSSDDNTVLPSTANISGDGSFVFDLVPDDAVSSGQFSEDGGTFTALAHWRTTGTGPNGGPCNDNVMVTLLGVRISSVAP
jgi:hypothetical protein